MKELKDTMGTSAKLFTSTQQLSRDELADFLSTLADRLRGGEVRLLQSGSEPVVVAVPAEVSMDLEVTEQPKRSGIKREIEIELEWYEDESGEPVSSASSGVSLG